MVVSQITEGYARCRQAMKKKKAGLVAHRTAEEAPVPLPVEKSPGSEAGSPGDI